MQGILLRSTVVFVSCWFFATGAVVLAQREPLPFSAGDADRLFEKVVVIAAAGGAVSGASRLPGGIRTLIEERELNAYLAFRAGAHMPVGVVNSVVLVLGDGRLVGRADVDLDAVRLSRERGLFDPMRFLRGRMPIEASGVLRTESGIARFELESASASGVPIPKSILKELVYFYTRTAARPEGFDLDAPFQLPAAIREIEVRAGHVVIVQ